VTDTPTLVCVHAHPDDEALFTGGATSYYAERGYSVVLVTCTNGQFGIDPRGRAGDDPRHDAAATRAARASELQVAAHLVGCERLVNLGFDDSGMTGWRQNEAPSAFANCDVESTARVLASLFDALGATVVITYDENGFYGHPDHVMANRVTRRAIDLASAPERLYYPIVPQSVLRDFVPDAKALEVFLPAWVLDAGIGVADDLVATTLDVGAFVERKQAAIAAHATQIDNADLVSMDHSLFLALFGTEYYQRAWTKSPATGDATDLFGGLSWN
jgi:LmbE family N-acetylglucosaminyl deacetylase